MIEIQTAVNALIGLLATGGSEAAVEIFKGAAVKGAEGIARLWRDIFTHEPESYPLANQVAKNPDDPAKQQQLRQLLEETLQNHPELLQSNEIGNINIKAVKAKNGGVAVGVNIGGQINLKDS